MAKTHWIKMKFTSQWPEKAQITFFDESYRYLHDTVLGQMKRDKPVWICLRDNDPTRSVQQNALYWVYLETISRETGDTKEALHEDYKKRFVTPSKEKLSNGHIIELYRTTTEMTKKEFSDYIRSIEMETGILVPPIYTHEL